MVPFCPQDELQVPQCTHVELGPSLSSFNSPFSPQVPWLQKGQAFFFPPLYKGKLLSLFTSCFLFLEDLACLLYQIDFYSYCKTKLRGPFLPETKAGKDAFRLHFYSIDIKPKQVFVYTIAIIGLTCVLYLSRSSWIPNTWMMSGPRKCLIMFY